MARVDSSSVEDGLPAYAPNPSIHPSIYLKLRHLGTPLGPLLAADLSISYLAYDIGACILGKASRSTSAPTSSRDGFCLSGSCSRPL